MVPQRWTRSRVWIATQRRGGKQNTTQHKQTRSAGASQPAGQPAGLAAEPRMVQWRGICGPMQERTAAEPSNMYFYPIRFTSSRLKNFPELSSFWLTFKENCWNSLHCQVAAPTYNYKAIMVWGHTCMLTYATTGSMHAALFYTKAAL